MRPTQPMPIRIITSAYGLVASPFTGWNIGNTRMEYYRAYNMDAAGKTVAFKGFPAESDRDACVQAHAYKERGKWHAMELWAGSCSIDCSDLPSRSLGRRVEPLLA